MKIVLVFSLSILAAVVKTEITPEQHQEMMDISQACLAETGATHDMVMKALAGNFSDDPKFKEQLVCVGKGAGFLDEEGKYIREELKKKIMVLVDDEAKADGIIEKCADEKATPQETAFESTKCFFKEMREI
ncbi:unnamed protein product [Ceutorhynchus assimilis]|uniref:Uncharacterized protein n=1 Tax=Ceutorhynchus assimilis TaxID=467358 RepID=A0A9N9QCB4_9CUCU|nr:unnamed protein product [Ceutorhynchus assimilis]